MRGPLFRRMGLGQSLVLRFAGMKWLVLSALCAAGCSLTFDGDAPDLPLLGPIPETAQLPKLNVNPVVDVRGQRIGADNKVWMIFTENVTVEFGEQRATRAVNVDDPSKFELYFDKQMYLGSYAIWRFDRDDPDVVPTPKTRVHIRALGQADDGEHIELDGSPGYLAIDNTERQYVYWVESPDTTELLIQKRDNSFARHIPLPMGTVLKGGTISGITLLFTIDSKYLLVRDGMGNITRYSTGANENLDLGTYPPIAGIDWSRNSLLFCDSKTGFTSVPWLGGSGTLVLDPDPCSSSSGLVYYGNIAYYIGGDALNGGGLRRVPVDGKKPPEPVVFDGKRIIGFSPTGELLTSTNGADDYAEGTGDGWYRGWKFMERGLDQGFSADKKKLRWVDHAAQTGAIGELMSAVIPGDGDPAPTPLMLARNVWGWEEMPDGRVLVEENHAFKGSFNRVVIVDEKLGEKRWVAQSAYAYYRLARTNWDLIVHRWLPTGSDLVRVTVPH